MKAVIVSDTHGRFGEMQQVFEREKPFDMVLHAGDIEGEAARLEEWAQVPVHIVKGNCDYGGAYPEEKVVSFGSHKIYLVHGHRHAVKIGIEILAQSAKQMEADIAVFGHTHISQADERYGVTVLNPGSLSEPRNQMHRPTYIVLETTSDGKLKWDIKYLF